MFLCSAAGSSMTLSLRGYRCSSTLRSGTPSTPPRTPASKSERRTNLAQIYLIYLAYIFLYIYISIHIFYIVGYIETIVYLARADCQNVFLVGHFLAVSSFLVVRYKECNCPLIIFWRHKGHDRPIFLQYVTD